MKKTVAILLIASMLLTVMLSLSGCGLFRKNIEKGTEAAKLLLANERLDEALVGEKINFGILPGEDESLSAKNSIGFTPTLAKRPLLSVQDISSVSLTSAKDAGYTWSEFPDYSVSADEFTQFTKGIEETVQRVAEDIAYMKNHVGVTDKWVDGQMLRVFESHDMLLVRDGKNFHVNYRYTDENAKNVYETYSFMSYENGTTGKIRALCIPGERYEQMYENSDGFIDYFIAENSRGYWVNTRFSYHEEENGQRHSSFSPLIVKDGLGFGSMIQFDDRQEGQTTSWYTVFDPHEKRELFRVGMPGPSFYTFNLYMTGIKDGFESVSSSQVYAESSDVFTTGELDTLTTSKGVYTATKDLFELPDNKFGFSGGYTQFFYSDEIYFGSVDFSIKNPQGGIAEICQMFGDHAASLGLSLHCDMNTVAASLEHAEAFSNAFGESFKWNGYEMNSIENVASAREVLQSQYDSARADYEEVKDYEEVSARQRLSSDAAFAELLLTANGENRFAGTTITLSNITASVDDLRLFEDGTEYVLKVGLSRLDENGNPMGVNTVPLKAETENGVAFTGKAFTLSTGGTYEIPLNLDRGRYAAVVYVATKDGGIRVSEISKIAFVEIEGGEIESAAMHIEAINEENSLILQYEIKNLRRITYAATKESYSYEEIERALMIEILSYGAPYYGAVLEYENGEAVADGATLGKGGYRMMCYLATEDGLAQSYVYVAVE